MGRRKPVHAEVKITDQSQVERMIKKFTRKMWHSGRGSRTQISHQAFGEEKKKEIRKDETN